MKEFFFVLRVSIFSLVIVFVMQFPVGGQSIETHTIHFFTTTSSVEVLKKQGLNIAQLLKRLFKKTESAFNNYNP